MWQHRRNIVEKLDDPSQELAFTENILKRDTKNYHAWQYRQWAIRHFSLWSPSELEYIQHLLEKDIRNNSAWNQRYFYLAHKLADESTDRDSIRVALDREVEFTLDKIAICVDNESAWNYLRALVNRLVELDVADGLASPTYPKNVVDFCMKSFKSSSDDDNSPFLLSFIIDYNMFLCKNVLKSGSKELSDEKTGQVTKLVKNSLEMLDSLANRIDTIRVNYWNFIAAKWKQDFKNFIN